MGTQWRGMGLSLMRLDSFRESILRSDEAVKPLGVKVSDLLLSTDESTFDDIVHAFVSLTAIQVGHQHNEGVLGHSEARSYTLRDHTVQDVGTNMYASLGRASLGKSRASQES